MQSRSQLGLTHDQSRFAACNPPSTHSQPTCELDQPLLSLLTPCCCCCCHVTAAGAVGAAAEKCLAWWSSQLLQRLCSAVRSCEPCLAAQLSGCSSCAQHAEATAGKCDCARSGARLLLQQRGPSHASLGDACELLVWAGVAVVAHRAWQWCHAGHDLCLPAAPTTTLPLQFAQLADGSSVQPLREVGLSYASPIQVLARLCDDLLAHCKPLQGCAASTLPVLSGMADMPKQPVWNPCRQLSQMTMVSGLQPRPQAMHVRSGSMLLLLLLFACAVGCILGVSVGWHSSAVWHLGGVGDVDRQQQTWWCFDGI